ncbi:hypothetical protein U9M48_029634 [Paspalum notatum var. saurae]|uniref:AP2/ERF domain-containing protein n=1 Tax=Paspalum notatum var. saurae TaxID=547442 RepID=A0AAQ3U3Q9_PASNO
MVVYAPRGRGGREWARWRGQAVPRRPDAQVGQVGGGGSGTEQAVADLAGSYSTAVAAARAYDTAVFYLRMDA